MSVADSPTAPECAEPGFRAGFERAGVLLANGFLAIALAVSALSGIELLAIFWMELGIIGGFALLALAVAAVFGQPFDSRRFGATRPATLLLGFMAGVVFLAKFGLLMLGLGVLLIFLPAENGLDALREGGSGAWLECSVAVFAVSHAVGFARTYLMDGGYRQVKVGRLLLMPYLRGLGIGIAILASFVFAAQFQDISAAAFMAALLSVKLVAELFAVSRTSA